MGSTTPLARALEAGPPARMVTAAGRADRYPSRTRRLRTEQVARRPQLPRSFVAQHAEKPLCRCGACPDVYSCSLKTVDQSILKDVRCILNTFAHTDPIRNAHTDARHMTRNGTCRAQLTYMQNFIASVTTEAPPHLRHMHKRVSARTSGSRPPAPPGVHHSGVRCENRSPAAALCRRWACALTPPRRRAAAAADRRWPRPTASAAQG